MSKHFQTDHSMWFPAELGKVTTYSFTVRNSSQHSCRQCAHDCLSSKRKGGKNSKTD